MSVIPEIVVNAVLKIMEPIGAHRSYVDRAEGAVEGDVELEVCDLDVFVLKVEQDVALDGGGDLLPDFGVGQGEGERVHLERCGDGGGVDGGLELVAFSDEPEVVDDE